MAKEKKVKEEKVKDPLEGFVDVSNRESIVYVMSNGLRLEVFRPKLLKVCDSGAHKVIDFDGVGLYINPEKGFYLYWNMKDGSNPYTF